MGLSRAHRRHQPNIVHVVVEVPSASCELSNHDDEEGQDKARSGDDEDDDEDEDGDDEVGGGVELRRGTEGARRLHRRRRARVSAGGFESQSPG